MLARQPDSSKALLSTDILPAIAKIMHDYSETTDRIDDEVPVHITLVLCVLIDHNEEAITKAMELGIAESLIRLLRQRRPLEDLLCGYAVNALQHLSTIEKHHQRLLEAGAVEALAMTLNFLFGKSITVLKICMQTLDRLMRAMDDEQISQLSPIMLKYNVIDIIWCNLRLDNTEMLCWTIHFVDQLACRDICSDELRRIPYLAELLSGWINSSETILTQEVLRILCVLSHDYKQLQDDIVETDILYRLLKCIVDSDDRDLAFYALALMQTVSRNGK
jgi:hypothetical protein